MSDAYDLVPYAPVARSITQSFSIGADNADNLLVEPPPPPQEGAQRAPPKSDLDPLLLLRPQGV